MAPILEDLKSARELVKEFPVALVTGGSGYIGSHTVLEILKAGCAVAVIDNLSNSHIEALTRVYHILKSETKRLGKDVNKLPPLFFHQVDLRDRSNVFRVFHFWQTDEAPEHFAAHSLTITNVASTLEKRTFQMKEYDLKQESQPDALTSPTTGKIVSRVMAVVHFAALKAVGESVSQPLQYYRNNIGGLLNLLEAMARFKVNRMVFSSSAVVYGSGKEANISEDSVQVGGKGTGGGLVTNPYGRSKWMAEEILNDCCIANPEFECIALRYFNPTGSHPSGLIGEDPKGVPNNIVPVILQTFQRRRSKVYVFGSNYDTSDGTGVRDYIHVEDLASGHLAALRSLLTPLEQRTVKSMDYADAEEEEKGGGEEEKEEEEQVPVATNYRVYNLGTGHGYSVLDIINAFAKACGTNIPFAIGEARAGDLGTVTAATSKAATELGWQAHFDIQDMCRDVYTFASENPTGYERLRKLSVLAMQDPSTMRKASVAAGLMPRKASVKDVSSMMQNYMKLSQSANSYKDVVARMNVINEDLGDGPISLNNAPGAGALFGEVEWEGQMGEQKSLPRRDSGLGEAKV